MKRYDIINQLIKRFNYKSYLEIGTQFGDCFTKIQIESKICVDPTKNFEHLTHNMTSDEFFENNKNMFDIVFVDGLHLEHQSTKDIKNSLAVLNPKGTIVVHDCLPHCEEFTQVCWNGTVFQSIIDLRYNNPNLRIHTIDTDCGCALISKSSSPQPVYNAVPIEEAKTYSYYASHKQELMNVISVDCFLSSLNS